MLRFERLEKIIGSNNLNKLSSNAVLILGCGGVGGYVAEALARSSIGTLILVDFDIVDETNINRQITALSSTIGRKKVDVLEERIKEINAKCQVVKIDKFITEDNLDEIFNLKIDFFVDACDTVTTKKAVIKKCLDLNVNFITSMGTGNKLDPSKLEIIDIRKTHNDPLARVMRKFVRDAGLKQKIDVLTSSELPVKTGDRTPGSSAFVPAAGGLMIASHVVRKILEK